MTDDTQGTDRPSGSAEEHGGATTPGPEATPDQEAFVAGLLGSLRADDPEIPDHVAARIDGVLAELARGDAGTGPRGTPSAPGAGEDEGGDGSPRLTPVTVLPAPGERRPGSSTRTLRWIAGAAAAVVVVGAGAAVVRGAGSSTSSTTVAGAASAPEAGDPVPIRSSGTDYSSADLAARARDLVQSASGRAGSGQPPSASGSPEVTATGKGGKSLLRQDTLAACIEQLTGRSGVVPVAIDQGTYEGKPADIVVLPSADDPNKLEVWAIGPGCTQDDSQLYEYRLIASPAPGTPGPVGSPSAPAPAASVQPSAAPPAPSTASSG